MKMRHLAAGMVLVLCAAMTVTPAAADDPDGGAEQKNVVETPKFESQPGAQPMSWDEVVRYYNRQRTKAESEEAIKQTEENSSLSHYYPE